jgi:nondiscriminating glutamyl-tRNA synthetase
VHWQKETLQRLSAAEIRQWLGTEEPPEFFELVRHNVVLPADAAPWKAVVGGELPPLGADEQRIVGAAGAEFFAAAVAALHESGADLKLLTKLLKERTGKKGAELFMPLRVALTGRTHGPELAPLLHLMTPGTARRRLERHAQNP